MNEYTFRVFSRRHTRHLTYTITKTESGWHIGHIAINGDCTPDGSPLFYTNFNQDYISYPKGFDGFLEFICSGLDNLEISTDDAQSKLQELADWVSVCESSQPNWSGWNI